MQQNFKIFPIAGLCLAGLLALPVEAWAQNTLEFTEGEGLAVDAGGNADPVSDFLQQQAADAASQAVSDAVLDGQVADAELSAAPDLLPEGAGTDALCRMPAGSPAARELLGRIVGPWVWRDQAHKVTAMGMALLSQLDPTPMPVRFEMEGDTLYLIGSPQMPKIPMRWADEPTWRWTPPEGMENAFPTSEDLALAMGGCDNTAIPRLIGNGQLVVEHGKLDITVRLMVTGHRSISGVISESTSGMRSTRVFYLSR